MSRLRKNIILTFDFELFLGTDSGTVTNCLKKPTHELLAVFRDLNISRAIFFVDTTYLITLKRNSENLAVLSQLNEVKELISELLEQGHYVFPHIHPHWLDASLASNNRWHLNKLDKFRFENCSPEEREYVWEESIKILEECGVTNYHPIDAFRAGGWSVQPFDFFKPYFTRSKIKYDFTVLPGSAADTEAQKFDFTNAPLKSWYNFSADPSIEDPNGQFVEFPISTQSIKSRNEFMYRLFKKILLKSGVRSYGDGKGVVTPNQKSLIKSDYREMISIELLNWFTYRSYVKFVKENETTQFISHPKMLSGHNLKYFRKLLNKLSKEYNLQFDFRSLSEA